MQHQIIPSKKQRTILLIDDCEEDREVYRRYLQSDPEFECSFIEAESGEAALAAYNQYTVDAVLLDYLLPDMDGQELLLIWQRQYGENLCPIIALTDQGNETIAVEFLKIGAVDYLVKSQLTPVKLRLVIDRAIATKRIEAQLSANNKLFYSTFEQAAVGIAHVATNGRWMWVNKKLCQILNYSKQELLQKTFFDITYPEDLPQDLKYMRRIVAGKIERCSLEKRYVRSDGSIVWVNMTAFIVQQESGEVDYCIAIIEDISDRKREELALQESKQKLERANSAKDTFIAQMSHEFRTPLNSIIGFSEILLQAPNTSQEQLRYLDIISQSGKHLLDLVNDILDVSKIEAGELQLELQDFNLIDLVSELADIFSLDAREKGLDFVLDLASFLPLRVKADRTKLKQVLLNLLNNAVKYTETGQITFTLAPVKYLTESRIRFQVTDTGIGIPPEQLADIFVPFKQLNTHRQHQKGIGLGLSIAKNLLKFMGCDLQLSSVLGEGSRFWFDLELTALDNSSFSIERRDNYNFAQKMGDYLQQPCRVLIVDDNEDNRFLLADFLGSLGFTIQEADNGATGLVKAKSFQPDIILLDLMMPVMNGTEMLEQIQKLDDLQNAIVFILSANRNLMVNTEKLNCHAFLSKPINLGNLLELLETHLQLEWATVNKSQQELVPPPQQELVKLIELLNSGDIEAIAQRLNLLEKTTPQSQYINFIRQARQFTTGFHLDKLEQFLSELITVEE